MPVTITIDDVSEAVRDELVSRAEARGQSLEEFLLDVLVRLSGQARRDEEHRSQK